MSPKRFHLTIFDKILGLPKQALDIYAGDESTNEDTKAVDFAHLTLNRRYMTGEPLTEITELYLQALRKNFASLNLDSERWTHIDDLWGFLKQQIPKAVIEVILGPTILEMYPDFVNQFWTFDDHIQEYSRGMLRHAFTSSPYAARDRILKSIKIWLCSNESIQSGTEALETEPFWRAESGSKLFRHRDSIFAGIAAMGLDGRASETLGLLQGSVKSTPIGCRQRTDVVLKG